MRKASLSPGSDYSLLSSLDALSLSTGGSRQSSESGQSSDFEDILVPSVAASRSSDPFKLRDGNSILTKVENGPTSPATPTRKKAAPPIHIIQSTPTKTKPTRRSGKNNRRRQEKLQGPTRDQVHAVIGGQTWDLDSEDGASLLLDDDESVGISEGEVNFMLGRGSCTTGSIMSLEDAVSSIDE